MITSYTFAVIVAVRITAEGTKVRSNQLLPSVLLPNAWDLYFVAIAAQAIRIYWAQMNDS